MDIIELAEREGLKVIKRGSYMTFCISTRKVSRHAIRPQEAAGLLPWLRSERQHILPLCTDKGNYTGPCKEACSMKI